MSPTARRANAVVFFLTLFFLLSGGHPGSSDALEQLRASILLASTGSPGRVPPSGDLVPGWVRGPDGRFYEPHDLGNTLLFLPAAFVAVHAGGRAPAEMFNDPSPATRVAAALMSPLLAGLACFCCFELFVPYCGARAAFGIAGALALATPFVAYARTSWDVLGAAAFMCAVLWQASSLLAGPNPARSALVCAAALAAAGLFRYSLLPFVAAATAAVFGIAVFRRRLSARAGLAAAGLFVVLMVPTLLYNFARTGSPLRPGTAVPPFVPGPNSLDGHLFAGVFGLLFSPNRGLFLFSPLLLLAVAVPFVWSRLPEPQRVLLASYGAAAALYVLLIAKMVNWGTFGWGPRYLVPVLPIVFFAAASSALVLWRRARAGILLLAGASALLALPAATVDWPAVTAYAPGAVDQYAHRPYQMLASWRVLLEGPSLTVPDWFLWRLAHISTAAAAAAVVTASIGVCVLGFTGTRLCRASI